MHLAVEFERELDPGMLIRVLNQMSIVHEVTYRDQSQLFWVAREEDIPKVQQLLLRLRQEGMIKPRTMAIPWQSALRRMSQVPVTVGLIVMTCILYPATFGIDQLETSSLMHALTFVPFSNQLGYLSFGSLAEVLSAGQFWRLLTPMFIHFSALHIVFNLLWVWEVGRRVELLNGRMRLITVVLVTSLGANLAQYLLAGPSLFGGMSGVVYGLLGYSLIWSRMLPARSLRLPNGIYILMLILLVAGFTGVMDTIMLGSLANGAHLGGLITGMAIATIAALIEKSSVR
jgi:GlpG protein